MLRKLILFFALVSAHILFAEDRVAFITEGSSGIGAATVREFIRQKIKVFVLTNLPAWVHYPLCQSTFFKCVSKPKFGLHFKNEGFYF